jgi:DNA-binding FadR family transcriptional regulator
MQPEVGITEAWKEDEKHQSQADKVVDSVKQFIHQRRLTAGTPLPSEAAMASELGVSRGAVREALRTLRALRVIETANGRRPQVASINDSVTTFLIDHAVETGQMSVTQVLDVRRCLETRTAALAALRRTDGEARAIVECAHALRAAAGSIERMTQQDIDFHAAIARASRNPLFELIVTSFRSVMQKTCPVGWQSRPREDWEKVFGLHETLATAIDARDPVAAERIMGEHFDSTNQALLRAGLY